MIHLAVFCALVGAVFGLRFKVMVLVPLTAIGGVATVIGGLALGLPASTIAVSIIALAFALQGGYLLGSLTRMTMAALRAPRTATARTSISSAR
jgi:hypothetical protein